MKINVARSEKQQERHLTRSDTFWGQTVKENNVRLNGKNIPDDIRDEIKFIQSVLLTRLKEEPEPQGEI